MFARSPGDGCRFSLNVWTQFPGMIEDWKASEEVTHKKLHFEMETENRDQLADSTMDRHSCDLVNEF